MEKRQKFSIWYVFVGIWAVLLIHSYIASMLASQMIPYSQFLDLLKNGKIAEVSVTANQIEGKMKVDGGQPGQTKAFRTVRVDSRFIRPAGTEQSGYQGADRIDVPPRYPLLGFPYSSVRRHLVFPDQKNGRTAGRLHDAWQKQGKNLCTGGFERYF
jgi:hypothetical protein